MVMSCVFNFMDLLKYDTGYLSLYHSTLGLSEAVIFVVINVNLNEFLEPPQIISSRIY